MEEDNQRLVSIAPPSNMMGAEKFHTCKSLMVSGAVRYTFGVSHKLEDDRKIAIEGLKGCETRQDVENYFKSHSELKNDQEFITACSDRCKELAA